MDIFYQKVSWPPQYKQYSIFLITEEVINSGLIVCIIAITMNIIGDITRAVFFDPIQWLPTPVVRQSYGYAHNIAAIVAHFALLFRNLIVNLFSAQLLSQHRQAQSRFCFPTFFSIHGR